MTVLHKGRQILFGGEAKTFLSRFECSERQTTADFFTASCLRTKKIRRIDSMSHLFPPVLDQLIPLARRPGGREDDSSRCSSHSSYHGCHYQ
ncbi:hypothetical protein L218DRAFT_695302 [Marasmius fiardii PR-910]|nr:hypothetical protein L218DRAFT_695302 [Marasmius fiardii PR-910]